jgi:hypothetical protein
MNKKKKVPDDISGLMQDMLNSLLTEYAEKTWRFKASSALTPKEAFIAGYLAGFTQFELRVRSKQS